MVLHPTQSEEKGKPRSMVWRGGRTALRVACTAPYLILAVPLSVGLLVHGVFRLIVGPRPVAVWHVSDIVGCAAILAALSLFAALSVGSLLLAVVNAWRDGSER